MKVQSFTDIEAFDVLQSEWNTLLKRSITDKPFSTYEWHRNWWYAYHPGDLWILAFRDEDDTLHGIASFFIESAADGQRKLHFVGCEDVTDYLDVLVDKDCQDDVYTELAKILLDNKDKFDLIDLCNIPAESPTYTDFPSILREHGFTVTTDVQEVCPLIPLPEDFDGYLKLLDIKDRTQITSCKRCGRLT